MFSYSGNSGDFRYGNPGMSASDCCLSAQTGFPSYFCDDYTDRMDAIMDEWKKWIFIRTESIRDFGRRTGR